jgi:uncharacterized protein
MIGPTRYVRSVLELCPRGLKKDNVDGLLLDIDGTLKDYTATAFPDSTLEWVRCLLAEGVAICLFSNGVESKVVSAANVLGVPYVAKAYKPSPMRVRLGLAKLGLQGPQVVLVGDQLFADVLAGRLAGLRTVLVEPTSWTEPWFTRLKRPFEMPFRYRLRRNYAKINRSIREYRG